MQGCLFSNKGAVINKGPVINIYNLRKVSKRRQIINKDCMSYTFIILLEFIFHMV